MKLYQIKHKLNDSILFELECGSLKLAIEAAVKSGANLRNAYLYGANLYGSDLSGADLSGAYLYNVNLGDANLHGANLRDAYLGGSDLRNANLSNANLSNAYLYDANLYGAYLDGAYLRGAYLRGTNLHGANLRDAKSIIRVGPSSAGYEMVAVPRKGAIAISTGCKHFNTIEEARKHWAGDNYKGSSRKPEEYALWLDMIERYAELHEWSAADD